MAAKYVRLVQDVYEDNKKVMRCVVGQVGFYQGLAPSTFKFAEADR